MSFMSNPRPSYPTSNTGIPVESQAAWSEICPHQNFRTQMAQSVPRAHLQGPPMWEYGIHFEKYVGSIATIGWLGAPNGKMPMLPLGFWACFEIKKKNWFTCLEPFGRITSYEARKFKFVVLEETICRPPLWPSWWWLLCGGVSWFANSTLERQFRVVSKCWSLSAIPTSKHYNLSCTVPRPPLIVLMPMWSQYNKNEQIDKDDVLFGWE